MGNAIPLGPGAGVMGHGVIVGLWLPPRLWPGSFPTGMNREVAESIGRKACGLDPRTWVQVLDLLKTCCEALGRVSL